MYIGHIYYLGGIGLSRSDKSHDASMRLYSTLLANFGSFVTRAQEVSLGHPDFELCSFLFVLFVCVRFVSRKLV